jgi:catechol 2,3-dioxygenase-like lactoylglutathione lyase family enzyme
VTHQYPIQRVTLITLGVADLARSRTFYKALGWHPHSETESVSFFQLQGAALGLYALAKLADDMDRPVSELGTGAMTVGQNFANEEAVDAAFNLAVQAGATVIKRPQAVFWGGYSGYFADPDDHIWELAMNPYWPLAADGSLTLPDAD